MQMTIKYNSGETRVINLTLDFFTFYDMSVPKRALDLAYSFAPDPYDIKVWREDTLVYEKFIHSMKPQKYSRPEKKIDESDIKKALRKEFKGKKMVKINFDQLNDMSK